MNSSHQDQEFLKKYFQDFQRLLFPQKAVISQLVIVKEMVLKVHHNSKKVIIVGNGGSAAIAGHVSVDLSKNAGVRCVNFNEASLVTCFANDYGYERWVQKAVEFYGDEGDLLVAISSSGRSKNILAGCEAARKKNFSSVITFSGFFPDNPLRQLGDVNFWVESRAYNFIENVHQLWLLAIVDLIIGKVEYSVIPVPLEGRF